MTVRRAVKRVAIAQAKITVRTVRGWPNQLNLIFPGAATQGMSEAVLDPNACPELLELRTHDGTRIAARFGSACDSHGLVRHDADRRPTVIFFYGNASYLAHNADEFEHFRRLGANVLIPEYLGYGMSGGRPSEAGCYATAEAAYEYLLGRPDVAADQIFAAGRSLGAAVAVELASRQRVAGLIVISAFTSIRDMARRTFPWLPASLLVRHHFNNLEKIPTLTCPMLIVHGALDRLVPPTMADRLAGAASTRVTRLILPEGDHANVFDAGEGAIWTAIAEFVRSTSTLAGRPSESSP
jgi:uncharacterized protein